MALELLAGPSDVVDGGAVLTGLASAPAALYDDDIGLYLYGAKGLMAVQLDGRSYLRRADGREDAFIVDLQNSGEYLVNESLFKTSLYKFNKRAGTRGDVIISGSDNYVLGVQVRAPDRYLRVLGSNVQAKPLTLVGDWTYEASVSGAVSTSATVSLTRDQRVLAIAYQNGTVAYYDWTRKAQVGGMAYLGSNAGAWYSPRHDIFVAMASDKVKVFANAPRPATISNPTAVTPLMKGRASSVKAQVLGADGEPCPGETVDWSLTGPGALSSAQSLADAEGWAWNTYVAPQVEGGAPQITAQVRF